MTGWQFLNENIWLVFILCVFAIDAWGSKK